MTQTVVVNTDYIAMYNSILLTILAAMQLYLTVALIMSSKRRLREKRQETERELELGAAGVAMMAYMLSEYGVN